MNVLVVVPVLGRPEHADRFMSTVGDVDVTAMCSAGDNEAIEAWTQTPASLCIVDAPFGTFASKAQLAYENDADERHGWIMLVGSDVTFHDGWLQAAEDVVEPWVGLISTNDMGNPFVVTGQHATHPIIRRAWVEEFGASWDGPGHIVHTGYHHAYCDAEWTARAWQDGVFRFAADCYVEHNHPTWGKGSYDSTYEEGMKHYERDHRLFEQRKAQYG